MSDHPILPEDLSPQANTSQRDIPKPLEIPQWIQELLKDTTPVQYLNEHDDMVEKPTSERVKELIEQKKLILQKFFKQFFRGLPALVLKDADLTIPVWTNTVTKLTGTQTGIQEWVETHAQWFPPDLDGIHDRMGMGITTQDLEAWEKQTLQQTIKELLIEFFNEMTATIGPGLSTKERVQMLENLANGLQGSLKTLDKTFKEIHPYPFRTKLERSNFFANIPAGEDIVVQWPPYEGQELVFLNGEPPEYPVTIRAKTTSENPTEVSISIPDDLRYPEDAVSLLYRPPSIDDFPLFQQREFIFQSFDERVDDKRIQLCKIAGHNDYAIVIDTDIVDPSAPQSRQRTTIFLDSHLGPVQWEAAFEHVVWWAQKQKLKALELCKKSRERLRTMTLDYTRSRLLANIMATV